MLDKKIKVILCGGGTGGHIFPMISIADEIKKRNLKNEILFVGSSDRMEMEIVPKYNYPIIGLWISGIKRSSFLLNILFLGIPFLIKNFLLPFKIFYSTVKSIYILIKYKPDYVIGFGGYSSGPFLLISSILNFKTAIQEQNSFPGYTNRLLSKRVKLIFVAYNNLEKFFDKNTVLNLGNPIRKYSKNISQDPFNYFNLDRDKKTILVLGGSLGAKSINEGILNNLSIIRESSFQVLWQTGDYYYDHILSKNIEEKNLVVKSFIKRMDLAYQVADIIISRAGAIAISELSYISKPLILIPSPNVVDDHQRKNANEIFRNGGCLLVEDKDAKDNMLNQAIILLENSEMKIKMKKSLEKLAKPDAAKNIVSKIYDEI
tara:strand:- start:674 stop:1798 length:1125 start_codon:yes stop_codon:yes gene_type:complete